MQGMFQLAVLLAIVTACSCQVLVMAETPSITIPSDGFTLTAATLLSCGIVDAEDFTVTWTTPNDGVIAQQDLDSIESLGLKYTIVNSEIPNFLEGSTLVIMMLSYLDNGTFTCSISFTSGENAGTTENVDIELSLLVEVSAVVAVSSGSVGEQATLNCDMSGYIRPDADFQWQKGGETITASEKYTIAYSDGRINQGVNGVMVPSRFSSLTISDLTNSDEGSYNCFVQGTDEEASIQLSVTGSDTSTASTTEVSEPLITTTIPTTTTTTTTTTQSPIPTTSTTSDEPTGSFPIAAVGGIAAVLGFIVLVLIVLIVVVTCRKRRKSRAVVLDHQQHDVDDENPPPLPPIQQYGGAGLNENTAYDSTSNGGAIRGGGLPKYARIDKHTSSPAPPLPARPGTNLSLNSIYEFDDDNSPPGYETPILNYTSSSAEKSVTIDPYYDNPDDIKAAPPPLPNPPKAGGRGKRTYYDEIEFGDDHDDTNNRNSAGAAGGFMGPPPPLPPPPGSSNTVPLPAAVLSGSLQRRSMNQPSPDFTYPTYHEEAQGTEHDYDQIYSEALDPTMLRHEYELEDGNGNGHGGAGGGNDDVAIPYSAIYEDPQPLHDSLPLRVTEDNVVEIKRLGMGQFGNVLLARTVGVSMKDLKFSEDDTDTSKSALVAIKKLKDDADGCLMEVFDKEVKFMARLNHDNVIRLLAVCTTGEESFIVMEYMENGDLNQFLQKQKLMPDTITGLQDCEVTPIILLYIGVQIASGMHYLGSHRFVHRDLATRNCLVGRDFVVKISDFGMSRSLYESAYYRVQGTLILPIRWMACETFYGKFSMKSDAWAFGVTLCEIYTLGKVDPYDHMSDEEVIADAIRGPDRQIVQRPPNCPRDVYDIMLRCWVHEPSMRADFGEIYSRLFMIYTRQAL